MIENLILTLKNKKRLKSTIKNGHVILRDAFNDYLMFCDELFGINLDSSHSKIEISVDVAKLIVDEVSTLADSKNKEFIMNQLLRENIVEYFSGYSDLCLFLAEKLGKKINPIKFHNKELRVKAKLHIELFTGLIHLFRNCVDHGLEEPKERLSNSKTEEGNIEVSFDFTFEKDKKYLQITIEDDGRGIDPSIIRNKISAINPETDYSNDSDEEIIYQIFEPRFSTRDEVTSISGKGVGMSAIKNILDKEGGTIHIKSIVGKGSEFIIKVPTS